MCCFKSELSRLALSPREKKETDETSEIDHINKLQFGQRNFISRRS